MPGIAVPSKELGCCTAERRGAVSPNAVFISGSLDKT